MKQKIVGHKYTFLYKRDNTSPTDSSQREYPSKFHNYDIHRYTVTAKNIIQATKKFNVEAPSPVVGGTKLRIIKTLVEDIKE